MLCTAVCRWTYSCMILDLVHCPTTTHSHWEPVLSEFIWGYLGIWVRLYRYPQIAIYSRQKITHFLVLGRLAAFRQSTCVLNTYLNLVYFHSTVACIIYPKFTRLGSARYPQIIWGTSTLKSRALQRALNLRAFRYPQIPSNFEFEVPSNSEVPSNFSLRTGSESLIEAPVLSF